MIIQKCNSKFVAKQKGFSKEAKGVTRKEAHEKLAKLFFASRKI